MNERILIFSLAILLVMSLEIHSAISGNWCPKVRRTFALRLVGPVDIVPARPRKVDDLEICPSTFPSCCTRKMEEKYLVASKIDLTSVVEEKLSGFKLRLIRFVEDFEARLTSSITMSRKNFFKQLSSFFHDANNAKTLKFAIDFLYDNVIIAKDDATLIEIKSQLSLSMPKFFHTLFALTLRQQFSSRLTEEQVNCVASQSHVFNYSSIHADLSQKSLYKALDQLSALVRAMESGIRSLNGTARFDIDKECQKSLVRMQYCPQCIGTTQALPCPALCRSVAHKCLKKLSSFDRHWHRHVATMTATVRDIAEDSPEITSVLAEISDQAERMIRMLIPKSVTQRIQKACSIPHSRRPRSAQNSQFPSGKIEGNQARKKDYQLTGFHSASKSSKSFQAPKRNIHLGLIGGRHLIIKAKRKETLKRETSKSKQQLKRFSAFLNSTLNFFFELSNKVCDDTEDFSLPVSTSGICWNGSDVSRSHHAKKKAAHFESQYSNKAEKVKTHRVDKNSFHGLHIGKKIMYMNAGKWSHLRVFGNLLPMPTKSTLPSNAPYRKVFSAKSSIAESNRQTGDHAKLFTGAHSSSRGIHKASVPLRVTPKSFARHEDTSLPLLKNNVNTPLYRTNKLRKKYPLHNDVTFSKGHHTRVTSRWIFFGTLMVYLAVKIVIC